MGSNLLPKHSQGWLLPLSSEAMNMETALHPEKDGTVAEVTLKGGDLIDAKDVLVVYGR